MKAIRVDEFGEPEVMRLIELAEPKVADKQVLVRIKAAGVNPVEFTFAAATTLGSRNCPIHREAMARESSALLGACSIWSSLGNMFFSPARFREPMRNLRFVHRSRCTRCQRARHSLGGSSRNSVCDGISSPVSAGSSSSGGVGPRARRKRRRGNGGCPAGADRRTSRARHRWVRRGSPIGP